MEVEGLAKPMAARLMRLARPGQILLSPVAAPLVHRASRALGERGDNLLWKSPGRWKFKGVPGAQEIHEVGEAGVAPLRMPKNLSLIHISSPIRIVFSNTNRQGHRHEQAADRRTTEARLGQQPALGRGCLLYTSRCV